jgi:hypothetical protein
MNAQATISSGLGFGMMPDLTSVFEKVGGLIYGNQTTKVPEKPPTMKE